MEGQGPARVDYVRFVRRVTLIRWRCVVLGFAAVALPVLGWVFFLQPTTYEATATLVLIPEKTAEPAFLREYVTPQANAMYVAVLKSRSLAQAVAESISKESREELLNRAVLSDYVLTVINTVRRVQGLEVIVYSPQEQIVREIQSARVGFAMDKDGTVTISALAFSPRVAVDIANTYVEVLLARSSAYARQQSRTTRELLETMLSQVRGDQQQASDALAKFQAKTGGGVDIPEVAKAQVGKLALLESSLAEIQVQKEIAQSKLGFLRGERPSAGSAPMIDPSVAALRDRLTQLQTTLAGLSEKYTETHPLVVAARTEMNDTHERLRAALVPRQAPRPGGAAAATAGDKAVLSKQMAELEVELMSLRAKEELVGRQASMLRRSLSGMGARELEYASLARTAQTTQALVATVNEKLTGARISEQSQSRSIQVVDNATLPRQPSAKKSEKILLLGLIGGLGLGLGLGTLREYVGQVIETEEDVMGAIGLPVLGTVPGIIVPRRRDRRLQVVKNAPPVSKVKPVAVDPLPRNFLKDGDPRSLHAEAFRSIRTTLQLQVPDRPLRTILVTSPTMGEGKTTVLLNLGLVYAESGRRVLLIDADLRRPMVHRALGLPNQGGLADVLGGTMEAPRACLKVSDGLTVMPAGTTVPNPSRLLNSRAMDTTIERVRDGADLVLVDAPPVLAVSDSLRLTSLVDAVILIARAGVTQRRSLIRAKAQLDKVGAPVVGVVINALSSRETRKYYGEYSRYAQRGARKKGGA